MLIIPINYNPKQRIRQKKKKVRSSVQDILHLNKRVIRYFAAFNSYMSGILYFLLLFIFVL